ncbi:hypothetical protein COD72_15285 [Bacillus cereus]|nr:hypothetical protein COD72_15285 [Bacillus cereus]
MSNFKYYRRNLKLHQLVFEILLVVFEIGVKIKKVTLERATFLFYFLIGTYLVKRPFQELKQRKQ